MGATNLTIRPCQSHHDLSRCVDLQRRIWAFDDIDVVPAALFVVAQHTGGHAYCAFDDEQPIGFALAFSGEHHVGNHDRRFWHSHMVGVLPEYQNQGVGRMLKLRQRDEALRAGIPRIEWTFDPLELRNAHFNIAKLGVIVSRYIPDCYGVSTSPLHGSLPTDRFVAEWIVDSPRVEAIIAGSPSPAPGAVEISVPACISQWKQLNPAKAFQIQTGLRSRFTDLFSRGYAITAFRRGAETCEYLLETYED